MATYAERSMSFGAIAADYDRVRPSPPPQAIEWLLPERPEVVVDLAAGTGLLTRALAGRTQRLIAVEPDARMRAVLADRSPGVLVMAGRGEAIPLPAAAADAVLISSAWHWLDPDHASREIARVLRDGGRLGVIWTGRDPATPWLRADEWFLRTDQRAAVADAGIHWNSRQVRLPDASLFDNIETAAFRFIRRMTVPDLVDWLTTYSRVITATEEAKATGRARAAAAIAAQFPGARDVDVPMLSACWRADRRPR
jgi:ubiquinone/menaquinone biosynthesis C-methylase UbiE